MYKYTKRAKTGNKILHKECGMPLRTVRRATLSLIRKQANNRRTYPLLSTQNNMKRDILANKEKWKAILG